jgi:hypothetical protein
VTIDQQFFALLTPAAVATAVVSGVAFGIVIHALRPAADVRLITYLVVVLSVIWYAPQWAALFLVQGTGWGTLGRWALFLFAFTPAMWATLRWRTR